MLKPLGISALGEAVYRALLAQSAWGVKEVAAYLETPAEQVRRALDELTELAVLRPSATDPDLLRPASPDVGLAPLLARAEAEMQRRQHEIEDVRVAIDVMSAEHRDSLDRASVVRHSGIDAVGARLESLANSTRHGLAWLNPRPTETTDAKQAGIPLGQMVIERALQVRCVYQDSVRNHPETLDYARWLTELGGQVRMVPVVPLRIVIFDDETALVPIDPEDSRAGALELRTPGLVAALQAYFEQTWSTATRFGASPASDGEGLEPLERSMLQLLAEGCTDEAVARKVGLSLRTVRRTMSDLMDRLQARSRFQAGALAALRGWL